MSNSPSNWTPDSWRARPIQQQPLWPDTGALQTTLNEVRSLPPLVNHGEVDALRAHLAGAARGKAFLLQGGDCAERFAEWTNSALEAKLYILLLMSLVLTWGARIPVIRVGRMAGQFAKPRSSDTETIDGTEMPSYRGDNVNAITPNLAALKAIRFTGVTSIFMHPVPRGIPILDTAAQCTTEINRARAYLEKCLSEHS